MVRCPFVLATALCASVAAAQEVDRTASAECRQALESLQAQETAVVAARRAAGPGQRAPDAPLEALRRRAAAACLGGRPDLPAQRFAQPPIVVPPVTVTRPSLPALPSVAPAGPPRPAETPTLITSCDAAGCWASDGSRLTRSGLNLVGPRGLCSAQGVVLHCP